MYIIKLGGSTITDKSKKSIFKTKIMNNLSKEIKKAKKTCIIVHGAGSFGHILAKKYNLNDGYKNENQLKGFSETMQMVQVLNSNVLKSLNKTFSKSIIFPSLTKILSSLNLFILSSIPSPNPPILPSE